jgi:hypothetical protein
MKRLWRLILLVLLAAFLVWAILFQFPLVYRYVIDPATRIAWFIARVFLMVDQQAYWTFLILAALGFLLWIIPRQQESYGLSTKYLMKPQPAGRVEFWRTLYKRSENDSDALEDLRTNLSELESAAADLSAAYGNEGDIVTASDGEFASELGSPQKSDLFAAFLSVWKNTRQNDLYKNMDEILTSMESFLEIKNGKSKK